MTITSALVLFSVIWFMTFLCVIPIHLKTQGDMGEIVPGTQAGAPEHHNLKKKAWITTAITFVLWVIISGIIISGWVTISDIDLYHRMASWEFDETNG